MTPVPSPLLFGLGTTVAVLALLVVVLSVALVRTLRSSDRRLRAGLTKSRAVLLGQVAEHFAPVLPGFPYQAKDAKFLGQPVDFVIFDGLSALDSRGGAVDGASNPTPSVDAATGPVSIVFCEIKTGGSALSARERAVRDAVRAGRVTFKTYRLDATVRMAEDR